MSEKISSFVIDYKSSALSRNLNAFNKNLGAAVLMYAATKAVNVESYMKLNRKWTDRTGKAKATLNTKISQPNDHTVRMTLAHGVDYGIYLELAHEKNYAIIQPTLNKKAPEIMKDLKNLMEKIKF